MRRKPFSFTYINSRYLMYEAQQAYFYGLPEHLAVSPSATRCLFDSMALEIGAVTRNPAEAMGMGHRIGYIKEGEIRGAFAVFLS
jgi:hypothetical protein